MSYLALYREFRPKTFEQIIGQEHVVKTLINQIKTDRVGHAYLFCGARGTGKTTAAKVFSRAINCLSPVNGSPCGECEVCKKLESPTNLDVLEMDAASNNKVENVRDIREKIQYPPVAGKYKVYIIDEVHMLTTEAFNALLKTLEEPPAHAVFILATTEVHKIPATILSRCLRFDFKLVATDEIARCIAEIYDKVGKKYDKEAVKLIAKSGEGSVRDALSIADICVSYSQDKLTYNDVLEVLGTSDRAKTEALISAMFAGETGQMLAVIDELCMLGKSVSILNRDVCAVLRDLLVSKTCKNSCDILGMPLDRLAAMNKLAADVSVQQILRTIEIFSQAEADLKYSTHPKIVFETAAVKASIPAADYNIDSLMARIAKLEKALADGEFTVKPSVATAPAEDKKPAYNTVNAQKEAASVEASAKAEVKKEAKAEEIADLEIPKAKEEAPVTEQPPKAEGQTPSFDYPDDDDLASLMREGEAGAYEPPHENQESFFAMPQAAEKPAYNAVNEQKAPARAEEKPQVNAAEGAQPGDAVRAWGAILRKLRADKEIMLWVACQDVSAKSSGDTLMVVAPGENEYGLLSKPVNVAKLTVYAEQAGYAQLKIVKDGAAVALKKEEDGEVEAVKRFFDGEEPKIN